MAYTLLADGVFVAHGVFIVAIIPSTALALAGFYMQHPLPGRVHYLSVAVMAVGRLTFHECPLVSLERFLRQQGGSDLSYSDGYTRFVFDHIAGLRLPPGSVFASSCVVVVLTVAAFCFRRAEQPSPARDASAGASG